MQAHKIILLDDDKEIERLVRSSLNPLLELSYASNIDEFQKIVRKDRHILYLMDIHLKDFNLLDYFENDFHELGIDPSNIILITQSKDIKTEIRGHDLGFRDYITKPFNLKLLRSQVDKHVSQLLKAPVNNIKERPFFLDLTKQQAFILPKQGPLDLTKKEFLLLYQLIKNKGAVFSRESLFYKIWDRDSPSMSRTVDMHISSLRKKIAPYGNMIKNRRSVGYFFDSQLNQDAESR